MLRLDTSTLWPTFLLVLWFQGCGEEPQSLPNTDSQAQGGAGIGSPSGESIVPCGSDKECRTSGRICDPNLYFCVECLSDADCDGGVCSGGTCDVQAACQSSLECSSDEVCSKSEGETAGRCVECAQAGDCGAGEACNDGICTLSCTDDAPCEPAGKVCGEENLCVECVSTAECADGNACSKGRCLPSICEPRASYCVAERATQCREDGQGFTKPIDCRSPCEELGGEAVCEGTDFGASGGSGNQGSGGGQSATGGQGSADGVLLFTDFEQGTTGWALSGGAPYSTPTRKGGKVCESIGSYTLGWPAGGGSGLTLEPGEYSLSFELSVGEADTWDSVEAKLAFSEQPYTPVYFQTTLDNLSGSSDEYSFDFSIAPEATQVGLAFNVSGIESEVCFDSIELKKKD